ncbi:MAG: sulfotransferase [Thermomicrobiales bacterium]|nr:sulfotransferase [Thermomicrobiales bacterium]
MISNLALLTLPGGDAGILETCVTAPVSGGTSRSAAIRVTGHVLAASGPVQRIEAVVHGHLLASGMPNAATPDVIARFPAEPWAAHCGFSLLVDTVILHRSFEFGLRVHLADGAIVNVASVSGERRRLSAGYEPRLQPLIINSFGRTGTTLLMRMLAAHPQVIVYDRPPYEIRGSKYWLHALRVLGTPADGRTQIGAAMQFHEDPRAAGGNPFYSSEFSAAPDVEAWSGSTYLTDLVTFCQRSIDDWYLETAAAQDRHAAPLIYYAEKHFPDLFPRLLRDLYPGARELFLVRDFRDMIASMLAYNEKKGSGDFGRDRVDSDEAWLDYLRQNFTVLLSAWQDRGEPGSLVRYEDLVRQPGAALAAVLDRLSLDASPAAISHLLAAADAPELQGHGSSRTPAASIGRWREDLAPEMQQQVAARFSDLLQHFGYHATSR